MKVIAIAICFTGTMRIVAQNNELFPPPRNFQMNLNYIMLDDWGMCAGESVYGPYHCTNFVWEEPNLSETENQLIGYKIYYYPSEQELVEIPFSEGQMIAQTVDVGFEVGGGFDGYTWVTAIYSEPDGESTPSNVEYLDGLPVAINKNEIKAHSIVYNNQIKSIEIIGIEDITSIDVFDICGRLITASKSNDVDVKHLKDGIYIIRISTKIKGVISDKLLIQ